MKKIDVENMDDKALEELQAELGKEISEIAKGAEKTLSKTIKKLNKLLTPYGIEATFALQLIETPKE